MPSQHVYLCKQISSRDNKKEVLYNQTCISVIFCIDITIPHNGYILVHINNTVLTREKKAPQVYNNTQKLVTSSVL